MGSLASCQAAAKNKTKSALSSNPKFSSDKNKNINDNREDKTTNNNNPTAVLYREMKKQIKYCLKKFSRTRFTVDDLVERAEDPRLIIPIRNLLSRTKSGNYSRDHVPGIHKVLVNFFERKDIPIPSLLNDDDQSMKSVVSEITNMTGVSAGGAESFHKDFHLGHQPGDPIEDNGNENTSINMAITGVTLNKTSSNNTSKVIITNLNKGGKEFERNNEDQDDDAVTKMTSITGNIGD
eukprot:5076036-Ditylum_brightwellii.AAC.1